MSASKRDQFADLRYWFTASPGNELWRREQAVLADFCEALFGYKLLQLGDLGSCTAYLSRCPVQWKAVVGLENQQPLSEASLVTSFLSLPVASDSLDVVILPHTLDFSPDPHQMLREVERVLVPEGRLVLLGFNPYSLYGLWRLFLGRGGRVPWSGQFLSFPRLHDWLSLLGFELERTEVVMFRPPLSGVKMMSQFGFLERLGKKYWPMLSGVYAVQAVRRVSTLKPIGQYRSRFSPLSGVMEPNAREVGHGRQG